jgi:hypothetical protein
MMNTMMEAIDPQQFQAMESLRNELRERFPEYDALCGIDPSVHEGLAVIINRRSGNHKDRSDHPKSWALMTTLGSFQGGDLYFKKLGLHIQFGPGDFIALKGRQLDHEVEVWQGGLRISLVYFTHESLWRYMGRELP